jgi:uncharacterized oligopeptide transporter (OPT) family protein
MMGILLWVINHTTGRILHCHILCCLYSHFLTKYFTTNILDDKITTAVVGGLVIVFAGLTQWPEYSFTSGCINVISDIISGWRSVRILKVHELGNFI